MIIPAAHHAVLIVSRVSRMSIRCVFMLRYWEIFQGLLVSIHLKVFWQALHLGDFIPGDFRQDGVRVFQSFLMDHAYNLMESMPDDLSPLLLAFPTSLAKL